LCAEKDKDEEAARRWEEHRPRTLWQLPPDDVIEEEFGGLVAVRDSIDQRPGDSLIVGITENSGYVYALRQGVGEEQYQVHPETMNAWYDALAAVPRSLHYFMGFEQWTYVGNFPTVQLIGGRRRQELHGNSLIPMAMDGPSFGLGFALSIASCLIGQNLPLNMVALATCGPFGTLGPVDGLEAKLEAIRRVAPRIDRVFIANSQEIPHENTGVFKRFRFLRFRDLQTALGEAFPEEELNRNLRIRIREGNPRELAKALLHYVLLERQRPNSFSAIIETGELIKGQVREKHQELMPMLEFSQAVALRHDGEEPEAASLIPASLDWAEDYPEWLKLHIYAEYCQHAYDTATPSIQRLSELVGGRCLSCDAEDASFEELRLLGAWWRVAELEGRYLESMKYQMEFARQWLERRIYEESTRPITRGLILASGLRDGDAVDELEELATRALAYLDRGDVGRTFVRLSQFRAAVCLERFERAESLRGQLERTERLPLHLSLCADRFAILMPEHRNNASLLRRLRSSRAAEREYKAIVELELALCEDERESVIQTRVSDLENVSDQFRLIYGAVQESADTPHFDSIADRARRALDFYPY
jgi:hypothetical protein